MATATAPAAPADDDDHDHVRHCVVCDSDMTEIYHLPVSTPCSCVSRICQFCRQRIRECPTCRQPLDPIAEVDTEFLQTQILLGCKGKRCTGCQCFVRSRRNVQHNQECAGLLRTRLRETMDELLHTELAYRKSMREIERLRIQMGDMTYQLAYLHRYYIDTREVFAGADSDSELVMAATTTESSAAAATTSPATTVTTSHGHGQGLLPSPPPPPPPPPPPQLLQPPHPHPPLVLPPPRAFRVVPDSDSDSNSNSNSDSNSDSNSSNSNSSNSDYDSDDAGWEEEGMEMEIEVHHVG